MSSPRLAAAALLLFGSLSLPAGARDPAPDVKTWTVDEGTAGALVEDHRVGLIGIELRFAAGTWSGWAREAHAKEAFEIQLYDSAGSLRARADALAAGLALSMDERRAALRASCLKEDLPEVLALVRDVLSNRDFERAQLKRFAKERQIEWDSSLKDPYYRATQAAVRALFGPTDPRRIGWEKPAPVETATARLAAARDSLLRLPGRAVAFWGDLTREEAERAAAGLLPPVSRDGPRRLEPDFGPVTPAVSRARDHEERLPRLTQVYFSYGRESLPYTDPDYPAFLVADHVLGGHFYSRLYVALRHEGGETYGAGTRSLGDVVVGPYGLFTFTRAPNAASTETKLREVLRVFHEKGITAEERAAAVSSLEGRRLLERQSPQQVLTRFLSEREMDLPPGFLDEAVERASQRKLEDVNGFISRWYDPEQFEMIRVVPAPR